MTATVERIQLIAQGRGEAIRVCTGALCPECHNGRAPEQVGPRRWEHLSSVARCPASPIWTAIKAAGWV